ncbi:TonB-dependent receptor plug domain-containing protein [Lewinella sp. JB7]|uniref:TonB-dependent receptor plug domain-containing protein n=1 Tax=Lewinella sp. JB7 TaxID=2962887 RepID=UPI0020C9BAA6|nr:TonB-dependent receptor plug domain-containing protein [Lewinella sp. JB7]MCP9237375.1 Plug domain-containing protein [Lewinella sp. JB7]
MLRSLLFLGMVLLFGLSCGTPRETTDAERVGHAIRHGKGNTTVEVDAAATGNDLTSYLRRVAGVSVRGNGPSATVRIRGDVNFGSDSTPLFVVNGTILGNNFASVYSTVDINEISRVTVLKNLSDTNRYGLQGGNGVIEIKLKE